MHTNPSRAVIMLVDDEPHNLDVLFAMLEREGYEVLAFTDPSKAIHSARGNPPDLVLLDVRMPGMDGYETCRAFQGDPVLQKIPILFISALRGTEDIAKGFEVGGRDYIEKPFREAEILARIETHLALQNAMRLLDLNYQKLRDQEALRDRLVHMIVHDMRSPLQAVLGNLQLMELQQSKDSAEENRLLRTALTGVNLLLGMTSDLLNVSRLEEGALPVDPQPVPLGPLVEKAIAETVAPSDKERIHVDASIQETNAFCDPDLTLRILANLMGNALKYSPRGAPVSLTAETDNEGGVRIRVRDEGPGIDPQYHHQIFEKFGVIPADETSQRMPSTGVGLAFCKLAMEAQNGSIQLDSALGEGSTFSVVFPVGQK